LKVAVLSRKVKTGKNQAAEFRPYANALPRSRYRYILVTG